MAAQPVKPLSNPGLLEEAAQTGAGPPAVIAATTAAQAAVESAEFQRECCRRRTVTPRLQCRGAAPLGNVFRMLLGSALCLPLTLFGVKRPFEAVRPLNTQPHRRLSIGSVDVRLTHRPAPRPDAEPAFSSLATRRWNRSAHCSIAAVAPSISVSRSVRAKLGAILSRTVNASASTTSVRYSAAKATRKGTWLLVWSGPTPTPLKSPPPYSTPGVEAMVHTPV
jgi:hypothetical protein